MKYAHGLAALLALTGWAADGAAQGIFVPGPPPPPPGGVTIGGGIGFTRTRPGRSLSLYLSGGFTSGYYGAPPFGYFPPPITIVKVYTPPPPPPVFVLPPLPPLAPSEQDLVEVDVRRRLPPALPPLMEGPFGRDKPNQPREPPAERPMPPQPPAPAPPPPPPPKVEEPKPKPPEPPAPPGLRPVAPPDANPREEAARQIARGKEAFAAGEYGLAAHRFRQATQIAPAEALGHLLLGESLFALGKYGEAVEAVVNGVRLQPDWPTRRFRPLDLYGDNLVEYPDHLGRLEDALRRTPDDPVLLFLYGYQLWFDGRQEEAVPLFQKALPGFGDKAVIERFLQVPRPGAPLL